MHVNGPISEPVEPLSNDAQRAALRADNTAADYSRNALVPAIVVQINGKQFVSGLFWQPLTQPRTYLKEAREMGKREQMKWFVLQRGNILQVGFVGPEEKEAPVQQGMFSLAAVLARKLGHSWIGVFPLEDERYAFIAVSDGIIIPGCDMIAERQMVQAKFDAIYRHFSWGKIYLPADFANFNYADKSLDLKALLTPSDLKREDKLKRLALGLRAREISAVMALILVVGFIYLQSQAKQRQRVQEEIKQSEYLRQQANLNTQTELPTQIKTLSYPWATLPLVNDFLPPCIQAIQAMPLVLGGWKFDTAKCAGQLIAATYLRQGNATANDFLTEARSHFKVKPDFYQQGKSAVIKTKISWLQSDTDLLQSLQPLTAVLASFSSHFQALGIQLALAEKTQAVDQTLLLPGQQDTEPASKPDWRTFIFSLSTRLAPDIIFSNLNTDSIRLTELSINLQDAAQLDWQIAGEIYAK